MPGGREGGREREGGEGGREGEGGRGRKWKEREGEGEGAGGSEGRPDFLARARGSICPSLSVSDC